MARKARWAVIILASADGPAPHLPLCRPASPPAVRCAVQISLWCFLVQDSTNFFNDNDRCF